MIDINTLTLGEVAKLEDLSGQAIGAFADQDKPKGRALAALAFIVRKREDPKFTWNQAQALTLAEAQGIIGLNEPADADAEEADPDADAEEADPDADPSESPSPDDNS